MSALIQPSLGTMAIGIAFKSLLLLALVLIVIWFMRRSSAASRHLYLAAAALALLVLPLAASLLPSWDIGHLPYPVQSRIEGSMTLPARTGAEETESLKLTQEPALKTPLQKSGDENARTPRLTWLGWIFIIWLGGASILLLRLIGGKFYGTWTARKSPHITDRGFVKTLSEISEQFGIRRRITAVESTRIKVPFVSGFLKPKIILPSQIKNWSGKRLKAILRHELAHIKRNDILIQFFAQIACCLYWINPLVWILERKLFVERERACDDIALGQDIKASDYAGHLMEALEELGTQRNDVWVVAAMAEGTDFKDRIISVLNPAARRHPPRMKHVSMVLAATLALLLPLSALNPWALEGGNLQKIQKKTTQNDRQEVPEKPAQKKSQESPPEAGRNGSRLAVLLQQLESPSATLRRNAVRALEELDDRGAVDPLVEALQDESDIVRERVCTALGNLGDKRAVQPLIEALMDRSAGVREHACTALGKLGDKQAVQPLIEALHDESAVVREHACAALSVLEDKRAIRPLVQVLNSDPDTTVKDRALSALRTLGYFK
jgi:beta-lactamase regulating signal transducer with metallopeptidase domain